MDDCGYFVGGLFATLAYCIIHMLLASLKPSILNNTLKSKIPLLDEK